MKRGLGVAAGSSTWAHAAGWQGWQAFTAVRWRDVYTSSLRHAFAPLHLTLARISSSARQCPCRKRKGLHTKRGQQSCVNLARLPATA